MIDATALVVEDDDQIRRLLARTVRRHIADVDEASDGTHAIEMIASRHYPVVLLDLRMPGKDGLEVFKELRLLSDACQVIVVTGHGQKEDAIEAANLHVFKFIEKPPNTDDLGTAVLGAFAEYKRRSTTFTIPDDSSNNDRLSGLYTRLSKFTERNSEYLQVLKELRSLQQEEAVELRRRYNDTRLTTESLKAAQVELQNGKGSA